MQNPARRYTRVFHLHEGEGVEVLLGALDDGPGDLTPTREGWTIRREPWVVPVVGAKQYARDTDGPELRPE